MELWREYEVSMKRHVRCTALKYCDGRDLTYYQLHQLVDQIETTFIKADIGNHHCIGLFGLKSFEYVATMLACLKAGIPYVPLDIDSPRSRVQGIIEDAGITHLICDDLGLGTWGSSYVDSMPLGDSSFQLVRTDSQSSKCDHGTAFILYTSGSTGVPKGVMISEKNALAFIQWGMKEFAFKSSDVVSSIAPLHFDLSVLDIFASLLSGANVVLFDQKSIKNPRLLTQTIAETGVSVIYTTPTMLGLLLGFGRWLRHDISQVRTILFAGEVMPMDTLRRLSEAFPNVPMYNLYGPTETNVVTYYKVEKSEIEGFSSIPIGQECPYCECRIDDQTGELHVGGGSTALGYVGGIDSERFYYSEGKQWYRTGDVVRMGDDGQIWFLGRNDRMIKKKGYRIELDEVESAARRTGMIDQVGCISKGSGENVFIYMYLRVEHSEKWEEIKFRSSLSEHLPAYMLPDHVIEVEQLPYTSNHKIDYVELKCWANVRT